MVVVGAPTISAAINEATMNITPGFIYFFIASMVWLQNTDIDYQ
jgi:hypothetical protein